LTLCLVGTAAASPPAIQPVTGARIENEAGEARNWLSYGRTYNEQRFSPLTKINADNVSRLGLAWYADLDTHRGQEATPLAIDGVIYVSTAWSLLKAYDGRSGKLLWSFDPKVPRELGVNGCCDVVSRGVAAWKTTIYLATFDGRLIAVDAVTGARKWSVLTVDQSKPYTITQAPRVINGRVIIGNSGGEYNGIRGYISAYDADTGKLDWRFFTVPGDPSKPFENDAMARAAKTWGGGEWWKRGGGGNVWDAISYDPKLNLLYFGTGNGFIWSREHRSANQGDNLFSSSIIAVNADSGAYVWHYQVSPGEEWDYDAVQQLILADMRIDGKPRHVVMQANKNGFFYVLDRKTGALLSAKAFVPVTWATGINLTTGRPIENPAARYSTTGEKVDVMPGPPGAHSWQAMAFNPQTQLAYIPAQEITLSYALDKNFKIAPIGMSLGADMGGSAAQSHGFLLAWDPVKQREAWRVQYAGPWNGGIVTTAGNIVAQGDAAGNFDIYRANDGKKLWSLFAQSGIIAAPSVYEVDGEEYIAVLSGWGGVFPLAAGPGAAQSGNLRNISRLLVFKLGGTAALPRLEPSIPLKINPLPEPADTASVNRGGPLFAQFCGPCHGGGVVGGGITPDLRASGLLSSDVFYDVVLNGILKDQGMVSFKSALTHEDVTAIRNYIIHRANDDAAAQPVNQTH
jgi:alcohol dehydrogenase (cytochrome c)/quinohemoprotein ethanol dehydrogenase